MSNILFEDTEAPVSPESVRFAPSIITLMGPPLVGKSTLGRELGLRSNLCVLDVDSIRQQYFPTDPSAPRDPEEERIVMARAYDINHARAVESLSDGNPVVLIATYSRINYHELLTGLQRFTNVPLVSFLLSLPPQIADVIVRERLEGRRREGSDSNITSIEAFNEVTARYQPFADAEVVDASQPVEVIIEQILSRARRLIL